ncbi:MAG TPA: penicillin-insensitive murein endopeptidase [Dongiaceae bacterium]|nr:penicillin-insensitive murein endopeptidase [Dongiaceae bacterium]
MILISLFIPVFVYGAEKSVCYGTTDRGHLKNGWQLPSSGDNFEAYSLAGVGLGRNYVHSTVHAIVLESYASLYQSAPDKHFVYGETGKKEGGKFSPHKTHQNGLSVDFFVPVVDASGKSVPLPISPLNKFGYDIEFSNQGKYDEYQIDFDAMADHLLALKKSADAHGIKIWRVIFDNELQKPLFASAKGGQLKSQLTFSTKKPWVRHDEHYHVDFIVPCQ